MIVAAAKGCILTNHYVIKDVGEITTTLDPGLRRDDEYVAGQPLVSSPWVDLPEWNFHGIQVIAITRNV